ncbi:TetR/AcrR family transcriptional regulator [Streptomyces sp. NPDC002573]|uniref:TetR/AcrR family transcriptional regulator n=1 Tax=Streptomyces sp. NPDC002573 TaxID=3364651 RepID=UPI0036C64C51
MARRAGLGNATLYRHFAGRRELIRTVTLSLLSRTAEQAEAALAEEPTPFEAVRRFVHRAVDENFAALCPILADCPGVQDPEVLKAIAHLTHVISALFEAAQRSGRVRLDVSAGELAAAVSQLARPLPGRALNSRDPVVHR